MVAITLNVRSGDLPVFARKASAYPERVERALADATEDATRHAADFAEEEMRRRAGGVYWRVRSQSTPSMGGARGSVTTDKNRAHKIYPSKPDGVLGPLPAPFPRFVRFVDHPGSRPLDWLSPLRRSERPRMEGIYRDALRGALGSRSGSPVGSL